jgi:2-haloacid dehalogenase
MQALDPAFESVFGGRGVHQQWFQRMLRSAVVSTVTGGYRDFTQLGRAALEMTVKRRGIELSLDQQQQILGTVRQLSPHPDVIDGLRRLRDAGFRMAALTNSTAEVAEAQLQYAGLRDFFEHALSADMAKRLKPARKAYHMAAQRRCQREAPVITARTSTFSPAPDGNFKWSGLGADAGCRSRSYA